MLESLFNKVTGLKACNFTKKKTPTQMFSCEFLQIFKNIFFIEHLWWLLLKRVCEGKKSCSPFILMYLESITDASERWPLRKIMNSRDFSCYWLQKSVFTLCENHLLDFAKIVVFSFQSHFLLVTWCKIAVYFSQKIKKMFFFCLYETFNTSPSCLWQKQTQDIESEFKKVALGPVRVSSISTPAIIWYQILSHDNKAL